VRVRSQLPRFVAVGAAGFLIEALLLHLLVTRSAWSPFTARAVSFPLAVVATFLLNRAWTFPGRARSSPFSAFGGYLTIQLIGAAINLLVYVAAIEAFDGLRGWPVLALACGAAAALAFNFSAARAMVFRT
jgi:putative flippase GtrA